MGNTDDHRWNLNEGDKGCTSECDDAFEEKLKEWQARDWMDWLGTHQTRAFWPRRSSSNRHWLACEIGQQPVKPFRPKSANMLQMPDFIGFCQFFAF
jgi:hypothetical protein